MERETSEVERKEKKKRLLKEGKKGQAVSFRFGPVHSGRLAELAAWCDISQTDLMRRLIDQEHKRISEKREAIRQGQVQRRACQPASDV